jgi:alkylation response protein AidB-like acyl-CoA dehydrogenase
MYKVPMKDLLYTLSAVTRLKEMQSLGKAEMASDDVITAVLEEAAKLAENSWAPLNTKGDRVPPTIKDKTVSETPGFKDAYQAYVAGGWNALTHDEAYGGQGLPWCLGMAVNEMWQSANLSLSLCPLLTQAGIEAIHSHGSQAQKDLYLAKLISGEWAGTMNLTEPQAGTDLAAIRSVATKDQAGDFYRLRGQKIYITFGDHQMTDNIIHLVLARVDGLPEGNDGLGLFIVPKFLVNADGSLGARNDVYPISLEHKLGIHGSPTCVMAYGDQEGAIAYLIGEAGKGLKYMFTMMNNARISVGLQGVALCERAYQHALAYAKDRVQGFKAGDPSGKRVAIIEHMDVKRMLMTMKAYTAATRALAYYAGSEIDVMHLHPDEEARKKAAVRVDLLTPLVKAWSTDLAVEMASIGVQIHGGMGFVEETGAAQYYRDARILPIYEGTNGIQANDLLFRKILRDKGAGLFAYIVDIAADLDKVAENTNRDIDLLRRYLRHILLDLKNVTEWLLVESKNIDRVAATAVLYLKMLSMIAGGHMMLKLAMHADQHDDAVLAAEKRQLAGYYGAAILPQVKGYVHIIMGGQDSLLSVHADFFDA